MRTLTISFILICDLFYITGQQILPRNDKYTKASCRQNEKCDDDMAFLHEQLNQQHSIVEKLQKKVKNLEAKLKAPKYDAGTAVGRVTSNIINEASGLCFSRRHKDILYTHNDSGGESRIFVIDSKSGRRLATLNIDGAESKDWEDIACGPCPGGGHCVYIGDIGGNVKSPGNVVYRIHEPAAIEDQNITIDAKLPYSWSEDNCETLMVDKNADIYLVSKVGPGKYSKVVKIPKTLWGSSEVVKIPEGTTLPLISETDDPVGGDISPNGKQILLKMYGHIWYWEFDDDVIDAMTSQPIELPSRHERQGEAVCWDALGEGYYTLAEGLNSTLWYFKQRTAIYPKTVGNRLVIKKEVRNESEFECPMNEGSNNVKYFIAFPGANEAMQLVFSSSAKGWAKVWIPMQIRCDNITLEEGTSFLDIDDGMGTNFLEIEEKGIYIETIPTTSVYLKVNAYRPSLTPALDYNHTGREYIFSNPLMRVFTIVATSNRTKVNITLHPGFRNIFYKGERILDGNEVIEVELDRLDTFSVASPYMEILADEPLAVFTGPSNRLSQINPVTRLDKIFVIPRIFNGLPYTIYSPHDNTEIEAIVDDGLVTSYKMNKFDVDGNFVSSSSHALFSNKAISVVFPSSDGTLYFPGINQYRFNYSCPLLGTEKTPNYKNTIHIVMKSNSMEGLTINDQPPENAQIREIANFKDFNITFISVTTTIRRNVTVKSDYYEMFVFIYEHLNGQRFNFICV